MKSAPLPLSSRFIFVGLAVAATSGIAATGWVPTIVQPLKPPTEYAHAVAPDALSPEARSIGFLRIEEALASLAVDGLQSDTQHHPAPLQSDSVIPDSPELAQALIAATSELPADLPPDALERAQFLIRQMFPPATGESLAKSFAEFHAYRQLENQTPSAISDASTGAAPGVDAESSTLRARVALRRAFFGTVRADRLFGEEHALTAYILALRRIDADAMLGEAEKEQRRAELQRLYERRELDVP